MSDPSHSEKSSDSGWTACPPGEIERLAVRLRNRRRRRLFLRAGAAVAAAAVVGAGAWLVRGWFDRKREPNFAGITCTEVRKLAEAYLKDDLSTATREQVRQHISQCGHCASYFRALAAKS
jgi:hypothetical protein